MREYAMLDYLGEVNEYAKEKPDFRVDSMTYSPNLGMRYLASWEIEDDYKAPAAEGEEAGTFDYDWSKHSKACRCGVCLLNGYSAWDDLV
jgi:hypothetical protein